MATVYGSVSWVTRIIMNNTDALLQVKADLSRSSSDRFISQEEMLRLVARKSGVNSVTVGMIMATLQDLIVSRFADGKDVLLPGIMRIVPNDGGLTRRYIKIQSISEKLKGRLK